MYPATYRGSYFYGDYSSQRVYTLRYDAQGRLTRVPEAAVCGTFYPEETAWSYVADDSSVTGEKGVDADILDLAVEEPLGVVLPAAVLPHQRRRLAGRR